MLKNKKQIILPTTKDLIIAVVIAGIGAIIMPYVEDISMAKAFGLGFFCLYIGALLDKNTKSVVLCYGTICVVALLANYLIA
ncbi:hypothetical protein NT239_01870 [Chitinibacter sp. SCUT-21]|uniref:hypothetical protein n=1 Tax=Chitinibacter sp. SCUT-21 TaxID=2970891 RepID=UPI0035A5CC50